MIRKKYAIRFPELQDMGVSCTTNIFSEKSIRETGNTFFKTFDALGSLTGYVIQKNKTNELARQIAAEKAAFDTEIDNLTEQKRLEFEEYSKRLKIQLEYEKQKMELDMKELIFEASQRIADFSISFEEATRKNKIFLKIIQSEKKFLDSIQDYIKKLAEDYSRCKEYVLYCELQRKAYDLINTYLKEMI